MNSIITLLLLLFLAGCREHPQQNESPKEILPPEKPQSPIEAIRVAWSEAIKMRRGKDLDSTSVTYDCAGERAGKIRFFSQNGAVLLIGHTYNEYSHFSAAQWYLVRDGNLIFAFEDERTWAFVDANATKDNVVQRRFYAVDGKSVRCLLKTFSIFSNAEKPNENTIPNKIIECDGFARVEKDFKQLYGLRAKSGKIDCLEK